MAAVEFNAEEYARASRHQKEWGNRIIAELALRGDERVLDLGCGEGVLTAELARRVPQGSVLGIDSSPNMIAACGKLATSNLAFRLMDIGDIAFERKFDVIFSNATLHWVRNHARVLAGVRRALRPAGRARFNFGGAGNCAAYCEVIQVIMARKEFADFFAGLEWPWYTPGEDEYRRLVAQAGFHDARVWMENADRFFADAEEFARWVEHPSLLPFLAHLPEGLRRPFRDIMVERAVAATRGDDGRCFMAFRRINVLAQRQEGNMT